MNIPFKKKILTLIVLFFFVSVGYYFWGLRDPSEGAVPVENTLMISGKNQEKNPSVRSAISVAQERTIFLNLSGVTEPSQAVDVEPQISGSIKRIIVKEGAFLEKGEPILELHTDDRFQKLQSSKTLLNLRKMQNAAAIRLSKKKFISPISLADTEKNLADARLSLKKAQISFGHLIVRAPFKGIVNQMHVEPGSAVSPTSMDPKVCSFVALNPLYILVQIPEKSYHQLWVGEHVSVKLANRARVKGKIIYLSAVSDVKTKTFKVKVSIQNPGQRIPSGMTASVEIPLKNKSVHEIHPSWITLSKEGVMGVMLVQKGSAVFAPVEILDSSPSRFYVTGLSDQVEIITLGQEMISSGVKVQTTLDHTSKKRGSLNEVPY